MEGVRATLDGVTNPWIGQTPAMPVVQTCSFPDCSTLTMGEFCLEHELVLNGPDPAEHGVEPELEDPVLDLVL